MVNFYSQHFWRSFARLAWLSCCNLSDPRLFVTQLVGCSADRSGIATLPRWGHAENTFGQTIESNTRGKAWTQLFGHAGHLNSSYSAHFLIPISPPQWLPFEKKSFQKPESPMLLKYLIFKSEISARDECPWHHEKLNSITIHLSAHHLKSGRARERKNYFGIFSYNVWNTLNCKNKEYLQKWIQHILRSVSAPTKIRIKCNNFYFSTSAICQKRIMT